MDTKQIIAKAGGVVKVARALGLTHPSVSVWKQVPPPHVRAVANMAGLHPSEVRPDLYDPPGAPQSAEAA